ncbi:HTH-type transcriptional regulator CymR [Pirellulimonas nuda]|uniref:HTH-type transcriptional regulator CymR n=1 Tax=Pirellulimonas nuda TaxID=2528009 RepID=A0A518DJV2_9BACT|nr:Rrf2 family transcriptional regulator [Pirellulimonas nuda]QDU91722.1 HTH-type transcriptional regulator CymR [Pirellulimonas nuda]
MQRLSAKAQYACQAMLQLAADATLECPTTIRRLADIQQLPERFLVQVLSELKRAGLVASTRGAAGGYRLARDRGDISLWDVIVAVDGEAKREAAPGQPLAELLEAELGEAEQAYRECLESSSLGALLDKATLSPMWHI